MFAKPKIEDNSQEKIKPQTQTTSPLSQMQKKNNMTSSVRHTDYTGGYNRLDQNNFSQVSQNKSPSNDKRLEKLEERISIISSQYDKFVPLLGMLDSAHIIQKADSSIKKIQKKQIEQDEKLIGLQSQLQQALKQVDQLKNQSNINGHTSQNQSLKRDKNYYYNTHFDHENNINNINNSNIINVNNINNIVKSQQVKLQDNFQNHIQNLREEFDMKLGNHTRSLEDLRSIFNIEAKAVSQLLLTIQSDYQTVMNTVSVRGYESSGIGELNKLVEQKLQEQIQSVKIQSEKEILNLWKDVGQLFVLQHMNIDTKRKEKLQSSLMLPSNLDKYERLLKINNAEQSVFIEEMDGFNKQNCQRLINELRNLEEKIEIKSEKLFLSRNRLDDIEVQKTIKEVQFMQEQFNHLKNQIDGTRKIGVFELKRIEDKMEQIDNIRGKISNDPNEKKDLQRITQDIKKSISFSEKISKLVEQINENVKIVTDFQIKIDEKLNFLQHGIHLK